MKKVIAYSFFTPKHMPSHRDWDNDKADVDRYYFNIPANILINATLYPKYSTVFYITKNTLDNPLCEVFNVFSDFAEYVVVDMNYTLTEPAFLRMAPLWDKGIDILNVRDIDSVSNRHELAFNRLFEQSDASVGTLRTHANHYGRGCCMLAGMTNFKPQQISNEIKFGSFNEYLSLATTQYGSDQNTLIWVFTRDEKFLSESFLDCRGLHQNHQQNFRCKSYKLEDITNEAIDDTSHDVLNKISSLGFDNWCGQPVDARGDLTNYLLNMYPECKEKLLRNNLLTEFYKVKS